MHGLLPPSVSSQAAVAASPEVPLDRSTHWVVLHTFFYLAGLEVGGGDGDGWGGWIGEMGVWKCEVVMD